MAASATEVKMNLLVDSNSQKVLFAEVGKDCVDFLFHILSLPLGTAFRLLNKDHKVGCIANLFDTVENLNQTYLQNNQTNEMILNPKLAASFGSIPRLSLPNAPNVRKTIYCCDHACSRSYASDGPGAQCYSCDGEMTGTMTYVAPQQNKASVVKGVVTYLVMDNLEVKPMSAISSIAMLNQFNVKEVAALQEKSVTLTSDKALKLLMLSLKSDDVLTNVFLR